MPANGIVIQKMANGKMSPYQDKIKINDIINWYMNFPYVLCIQYEAKF